MQVTITRISDKERVSAQGKPYVSRGIQTNEYGTKWLSGFKGKENEHWKVGDKVEIEVTPNGEYLNFTTPKATPRGGLSDNETARLIKAEQNAYAALTEVQELKRVVSEILRRLELSKVPEYTSDGNPVADFEPVDDGSEPPLSAY